MRWNSPWGAGFPGWHIECSAMAMKYLGETLDIHGAGVDNIFPHNEDEIAQSECATHRPFVRYWMHNGSLMTNGVKMSKSLGNFLTVEDAIDRYRRGAPALSSSPPATIAAGRISARKRSRPRAAASSGSRSPS